MKSSIFALSTLLWAGPTLAGPCRPVKPSSASSSVAAVSSSALPPSSSSSSAAPSFSDIVGTPASSSAVPSSFSSVVVVLPSSSSSVIVALPSSSAASSSSSAAASASAAPSSSVAPSSSLAAPSSSSASSSSSAALPSSSGGLTTNPGQPSCSTANLFVDYDLSLGLSYWPSNVISGSPTCSLGANCGTSTSGAAYAACLELDLVTLGVAEGIAFHQEVTVVKGTAYTGYFHYRLPALGASGRSMATLTCTMNGVTKYSAVLCADDVSQTYKTVNFAYTADCKEATFQCKVTTSAVTAQLQFTDFYLGAQC